MSKYEISVIERQQINYVVDASGLQHALNKAESRYMAGDSTDGTGSEWADVEKIVVQTTSGQKLAEYDSFTEADLEDYRIEIYDSADRIKKPLSKTRHLSAWACGITPYDESHLGHARSAIAWDILRRWVEYSGQKMTFVSNYTDIDDKLVAKAKEQDMVGSLPNVSVLVEDIADDNIRQYEAQMRKLNVLPPTNTPRATEFIPEILTFIQELIEAGYAETTKDGVRFLTEKHQGYGKFRSGTEAHFALWKLVPETEPGWESPWGWGRPGWHIEDSAMIRKLLGPTIDIHAGGADLKFPHHENEAAQMEALTGKPLANIWMHSGLVLRDGEKMSKSKGNSITIAQALEQVDDPMALRLLFLQTHYRKNLNITDDSLAQANKTWQRFKSMLEVEHLSEYLTDKNWPSREAAILREQIGNAMDDDLNTARAIGLLFKAQNEGLTGFPEVKEVVQQTAEALGLIDGNRKME